jgi:hypothetical protein
MEMLQLEIVKTWWDVVWLLGIQMASLGLMSFWKAGGCLANLLPEEDRRAPLPSQIQNFFV